MIDKNDLMVIKNIMFSDNVITKNYSKPNICNNILEINPISKRIYYDEHWEIIKISFKYTDLNELEILYSLCYRKEYTQVKTKIANIGEGIEKIKLYYVADNIK